MRYLHQICSVYPVVIKDFITLRLFTSGTLLMNEIPLKEPCTKWLHLKGRQSVHHGLSKRIGTADSARPQNERDPPSRLSLHMVQEMCGGVEVRTVFNKRRNGLPITSEENIDHVTVTSIVLPEVYP